jgi:hypothetical protein
MQWNTRRSYGNDHADGVQYSITFHHFRFGLEGFFMSKYVVRKSKLSSLLRLCLIPDTPFDEKYRSNPYQTHCFQQQSVPTIFKKSPIV